MSDKFLIESDKKQKCSVAEMAKKPAIYHREVRGAPRDNKTDTSGLPYHWLYSM